MPDFDDFLDTLQNSNPMKPNRENVVRCANCGAPNSPMAIVCANCGNAVSKQLSGGGFTVNKNAFGRESQPPATAGSDGRLPPQQFYAPPLQPQTSPPAQTPRYDAGQHYQSGNDYYSYYGNGSGRSVPVVPQRPAEPAYGRPEEPYRSYYANGNGTVVPPRSGTVQPYPTASAGAARRAAFPTQPAYGQNGYANTPSSYEVIVPESGPRPEPQWAESYPEDGYALMPPTPPTPPISLQPSPPQPMIIPPQPLVPTQPVIWPAAVEEQPPVEEAEPDTQESTEEIADGLAATEAQAETAPVMPEFEAAEDKIEEPKIGRLSFTRARREPEPVERKWERRTERPFDDPELGDEGAEEEEEYAGEWDEEGLAEPEIEKEPEPDTDTPPEDAYTTRLRQYKEQLRLTFDEPKNREKKKENKPHISYQETPDVSEELEKAVKSEKSIEETVHPESSVKSESGQEGAKTDKDGESVLVWKNIPTKGQPRPGRHTAPERPNLYKQNHTEDRFAQEAKEDGEEIPSLHKKIPDRTDTVPFGGRSTAEKAEDSQPVNRSKDYFVKPKKMDGDYDVTILTAEKKPETKQSGKESKAKPEKRPSSEPTRPVRTERSVPEQSPFPGEADVAQVGFGTQLPPMWAAYQQMVGGFGSMAQPVMIPPQMQPYAEIQGFPGMSGQPVSFQPGMMPAGIPIPMYVMLNPDGGMTMYYMNPASVPPMLPNRTEKPFEAVTGSQAAVSETLEKIRAHERYDGRYLAYMDFSGDRYLRWEHIRFADNIVGVKYPPDFDIENADFTGKDISFSDFSNLPFLKWKQIKRATSLKGIIYPREFNIERADYSGRDISQSDFSNLRYLCWKHIAAANKIKGIVYPEDFDVERADFSGRDISFSDFTRVEDLRWKHIRAAGSIRGIEYPAGFNIDRAEFFDRDVSFSDFTRVEGFRWHHIVNTYRIYGIAYPDSFDIDNADFAGRNISYSDFSRLNRLSFAHIRTAQKMNGIIYPAAYNMQRTDYRGRDISYSDFSLVKNMRFEHIAGASDLKGIVYPPGFDLENADFRGFDMSDSDFSLLPIYKKAYMDSVVGENITPPSTGSTVR